MLNRAWLGAVALGAFSASGCVSAISNDVDGRRVGTVVDDCVAALPPGIVAWGAPRSIESPDGSILWWDSVVADVGGSTRSISNVAGLVRNASDFCRGNIDIAADERGVPMTLLALTDAEVKENAARSDGRRVALNMRAGVSRANDVVVFFDRMLLGPGFFDSEWIGRGACIWSDRTKPCARDARFEPDPLSISYGQKPESIIRTAVIDREGNVDLYACTHGAVFNDACTVSRAPIDEAELPAPYLAKGFKGFTSDVTNAAEYVQSIGSLSLAYDPYFGEYLVIMADIFTPAIQAMRASNPSAPLSNQARLFHPIPPKSFFIGGGVLHGALAEEGGRTITVSYSTDNGLHVVRFRFEAGNW